MPLCDFDRRVAQQLGHALERDAFQEQRHGERVAEAVGMPLRGLDRRVTQQRGDAKGDQAGRHSIRSVLTSLAEGATTAEILADFPTLSEDDVREDLPMPELPIKR